MSFLLLMGIPRSGTTLAAALIDRMNDTVCLSEPDEHVQLMEQSRDASDFATKLNDSLGDAKQRLLKGELVLDRRRPDGTAGTNYFAEPNADGRRLETYVIRSGKDKKLSADALVCAKHNALYIAVLPELIQANTFHIVAMVRDPVAVLHSWRSLALPVSAGKLPAADRFWPEMRRLTSDHISLLSKQIRIYDLLCRRFIECGRSISILKYEDLLNDCTRLAEAAGRTISPRERGEWELMIKRNSPHYPVGDDPHEAVRTACALGEVEGLRHFYPQYG
jgi:Sulfotransferase domain